MHGFNTPKPWHAEQTTSFTKIHIETDKAKEDFQ